MSMFKRFPQPDPTKEPPPPAAVENSLRCPSTASFVGGNVVKFTPQGYDEETKEKITLKGYDVYGSVDSQNLFGATVRCQFYCRLYYNPRTKKWKLGDLRIHQPGLPALD